MTTNSTIIANAYAAFVADDNKAGWCARSFFKAGYEAALSQHHENVIQPVAEGYLVNIGGSGEHLAVNWIAKPVEGLLYLAPPDYEALCAENEALKLKLAAMEPKP